MAWSQLSFNHGNSRDVLSINTTSASFPSSTNKSESVNNNSVILCYSLLAYINRQKNQESRV